jgi:hypothetical protein
MKTSLLAHLCRKLGEGLGLGRAAARSDEDVRDALSAVDRLRQFQLKRKAGATRKDVRHWINEGRRV